MDQELREVSSRDIGRVLETAPAVGGHEIDVSNAKSIGSAPNKAVTEEDGEAKMEGEDKCASCVIDISPNDNDLVGENQRVCRICHLNSKESGSNSTELMEIGCGCKGELGVAHLHCAEAWFRTRGNR